MKPQLPLSPCRSDRELIHATITMIRNAAKGETYVTLSPTQCHALINMIDRATRTLQRTLITLDDLRASLPRPT